MGSLVNKVFKLILLYLLLTSCFVSKVSFCNPGYVGIQYITQAGLESLMILQPLSPKDWDYMNELPYPALNFFYILQEMLLLIFTLSILL